MRNNTTTGPSFQTEEEIRHYTVTKWRTLFSIFQENTKTLMQDEAFRKHVSNGYLSNLGERWRELQRTQWRLAFVLFLSIIFIGTIGSGITESIVLFGIRLSNENAALPILLLVSSLLMFFTSCLGLMVSQYEALMKSLISTMMNEETAKYYIQQFSWDTNFLFMRHDIEDRSRLTNVVILVSSAILFISLVLATLIVAGLQLYIFASSTLFVYENPRLPLHLNIPIVLVATCAFLFSVSDLFLRLPLPYSDKLNMSRLQELEKTNPEHANAIWENIAEHSLKRERRNISVLQTVVVIVTMVACELVVGAQEFLSDYSKLIPIVLAAVVFSLVFSPILDKYEKRVILKGTTVENKELRVYIYTQNKRNMLRVRLFVAFSFGVIIFFWIQ